MSPDTDRLRRRLSDAGYIAEPALATSLLLQARLQRPLLLEGDAGVGKTELAKALATTAEARLIRLQCYEGLDVDTAVYEWNTPRQLLAAKLQENSPDSTAEREDSLFSERYLLPRPLLAAILEPNPAVLLIDEIDRADEAFEAYLLELLAEFQVSIPELGTLRARSIPRVVITSNGTRELADALRRRCLYYYLEYPDFPKELAIVRARLPGIDARLASQVVHFVQGLRREDLRKRPGIAETLDWAAALLGMQGAALPGSVEELTATLGCLVKTRDDQQALDRSTLHRLLSEAALAP